MTRLVDLDDTRALDARVVGAKAARLARARRAGLPALDGVVVPLDEARPTIASAAAALADGGSGAARLAAMAVEVDAELLAALRRQASRLGAPLVVRSSSPLEADGMWAGAFSSYEDIGPGDLATAVRGVWASAFTVQALQRCAAGGTAPTSLELAVLVQRQVEPVCGGSARALADGSVAVHATQGSPRPLLGGWQVGVRARIAPDDSIDGAEAVTAFGHRALLAAAQLARRVRRALGDDLVEWAWTAGEAALLQSSHRPVAAPARHAADPVLGHPLALRITRLVHRFPGPLSEALVLPWAATLDRPPATPGHAVSSDPADDLATAQWMAARLLEQAWQQPARRADREAAATLAELRGPAPRAALERLATLRPVDPAAGDAVVSLLNGVALALARRGVVDRPRGRWRQTPAAAAALAAGGGDAATDPLRPGVDRWEPFVWGTVAASGQAVTGVPVVPGAGAGGVVVVDDPHAPPPVAARDVVVAERPLPALAPLLWKASAFVTAGGSPGAHLMEVAASLGVPTVLAVDLESFGGLAGVRGGDFLAAVDGSEGVVAFASA